tara:strand:- start:210 stop:659 length:450 start_codon:yes stop_codon:yes gene_type:complete
MKKLLVERFQELAGLKPLYTLNEEDYGDASTLGSDDNTALKSQSHFLNSIAILDLEDKYLHKGIFSDGWGFGDFKYDRPNAIVYWHLDSNAMGSADNNDKDFHYDLKTKDFVMGKSVLQNYWNVRQPEDIAIWDDIKNTIDKNITLKNN